MNKVLILLVMFISLLCAEAPTVTGLVAKAHFGETSIADGCQVCVVYATEDGNPDTVIAVSETDGTYSATLPLANIYQFSIMEVFAKYKVGIGFEIKDFENSVDIEDHPEFMQLTGNAQLPVFIVYEVEEVANATHFVKGEIQAIGMTEPIDSTGVIYAEYYSHQQEDWVETQGVISNGKYTIPLPYAKGSGSTRIRRIWAECGDFAGEIDNMLVASDELYVAIQPAPLTLKKQVVSITQNTPVTSNLNLNTVQNEIQIYTLNGRMIQSVNQMSINDLPHFLNLPTGLYIASVDNLTHKFSIR